MHSPQEVKDKYGDMFAFWGAIDQQYLMPNGTDEELEADIKERIEILGKGGGYMVAPAHIIQADVKPERVEKFIELCKSTARFTNLGLHYSTKSGTVNGPPLKKWDKCNMM